MAVRSRSDHYTQGAITDDSPDSFRAAPEDYHLNATA